MTARLAAFLATLVAALLSAAPASAAEPPWHRITVRIDPQAGKIEGRDAISFDAPREATLLLSPRLRIASLSVDGRRIKANTLAAHGVQRIVLPPARRVEIAWSGTLAAPDRGLDHRGTLGAGAPVSGPEGTFFPAGSGWYPAVEGSLERYSVEIDLPAGQRGLVPGRLTEERGEGRYHARFEFANASEGITLVAGPYQIEESRVRTAAGTEVRLRTYFHSEIAGLARGYLESVAGYLDLYERWIGAYPFSEFSVVSSPTPTGFGMPTLTYLGIEVLRLPFIRATSLGHEVLHNWWGNGVYPDTARGNWAEGLTNFMADYAYRERDGAQAAGAMRLAWLRDYAAMPAGDDSPLARFASRTHGASQVVGYNKAAMVFFMLREEIGAAAFDEGVRRFWREQRFRVASWDELRAAFERASGRALGGFFNQWLTRAGAPALRIAGARAEAAGSRWRLSVTLEQGSPAYALSVPLAVRSAGGESVKRVEVADPRATVVLESEEEPLAVALDPELRLFRRLAPAEAPPILREVMLARDAELALASSGDAEKAAATALAARMMERPPRERPAGERGFVAVLLIGLHRDIDEWLARNGLPGRPAALAAERGSAQVWTLRTDDARTFAVVSARDAQAVSALERPLPHYGQQSYLVFDGARNVERGVWPAQSQVWRLKAVAGE